MNDEEREKEDNIIYTCSECSKDMYPRKGKFTLDEIKKSKWIKAAFGHEHMWIKIDSISKDGVIGFIDNIPVLDGSPKLNDRVLVAIKEVEDIDL